MAQSFSINGELYGLKIGTGKYTKALEDKLERLIKQAAKEWMRAVILRVPVLTGFAKGSIKFAGGDLASFLNVSVPINPISKNTRYYRHSTGRRTEKTPEKGGLYSTYNFTSEQHRFRFNYRNNISYFLVNDFFGKGTHTPWNSMIEGRRAFSKYIRENLISLPKILDSKIKVPIRVGTGII